MRDTRSLASRLRDRIRIERASTVQDEYGEDIEQWELLGEEQSAAVYFGLGSERRAAAREEGTQAATFKCRANETTSAAEIRDRIVHLGAAWDIVGISPLGRAEIDFTVTRSV